MTYRIKRLKGEDGFTATPIDKQVSQWNATRDAKTNSLHCYGEAYDAKAKIRNEIFPDPSETYNCTTCLWGEKEHPVFVIKSPDQFKVLCTLHTDLNGRPTMSEGPRHEDIACPTWDRRKDVNSRRIEV